MTKYYHKMHKLMEVRNFSPSSISCYLQNMKQFARHNDTLLENITEQDIIDYLFYLKTIRQASASTIHVALSVIKFFYLSVLGLQLDFSKIPFPKGGKRLPVVLSAKEVKALLTVISNIKHKTILMTAYSSGLRQSEIRHLKAKDIDSSRMQIHVKKGKGERDRFVVLASSLLEQLRRYYKACKPVHFLFPGEDTMRPISRMAIQTIFSKAKKKPASLNQPLFIPCATAMPHTC